MAEKEREVEIEWKLQRAAQMLFFRRHLVPGVKGWELKRALGKGYMKIVELLNDELEKLGMEVKIVFRSESAPRTDKELRRARFFVVMKDPRVEKATGQRVDDLAILAASIAYIHSRQGKVPRGEVEELLREKFPGWKVDRNLDKFIKQGYLYEDEDILGIGWRTRAEVDREALLGYILAEEGR